MVIACLQRRPSMETISRSIVTVPVKTISGFLTHRITFVIMVPARVLVLLGEFPFWTIEWTSAGMTFYKGRRPWYLQVLIC